MYFYLDTSESKFLFFHKTDRILNVHSRFFQVAVNLIDKRKAEGELENAFSALFAECSIDGIAYEYFDFHHECAKMRYDRLSLLMDQLSKHKFGYFCYYRPMDRSDNGMVSIIRQQTGLFRTNCMDCLDRTNVVQSMLAAENMVEVLSRYEQ